MKFNDWLLDKLQKIDWSQADLARASGLTTASISKYVGGRIPDESALKKIAKAFNLPPETVFRAAGILPPVSELDAMREEIIELTSHMSREEQREVLEYIRWRKSLEEKKSQETTSRGKLADLAK
jgi:transcriptional regulator with XRE-family HTH domain